MIYMEYTIGEELRINKKTLDFSLHQLKEKGDILEAVQFIIDLLNEHIIDKAFNKKEKFFKKLPYIILYFLIVIMTSGLCIFIGVNYIIAGNIYGYFITIVGILFLILLILPFFTKNN